MVELLVRAGCMSLSVLLVTEWKLVTETHVAFRSVQGRVADILYHSSVACCTATEAQSVIPGSPLAYLIAFRVHFPARGSCVVCLMCISLYHPSCLPGHLY